MLDMTTRRNYEELCIIGRGAYGTVFKAKDTENDRMVALKRVRIINNSEEKGVPVSTLREITLLKQLDNMAHPNIVRMFDAFQTFSTTPTDSPQDLVLTIVFEHVEQDLSTYLHNYPSHTLPESIIKDLMHQLLSGIDYLHTNRMIHRDIKPQNILITKNRQVKIADFGLARVYGFCKLVTSVVVTLWYRAPEVLLHAPYATMVDLWSVGTIMAEMYNRRPLFRGKSEVNQLHKILSVIGSPDEEEWPKNVSLPWESLNNYSPIDLNHLIPDISSQGVDLLNKLLVFDPNKRSNAQSCLMHPYFDDIDYPDSQDSGISLTNKDSKVYSVYTNQNGRCDITKKTDKDQCNKKTIDIDHVVLPCTNEEPCPNEDDSSRGSDSGLENIRKLDMERLNSSFNESSLTAESRTISRADSGLGVSPTANYVEDDETCMGNNTPSEKCISGNISSYILEKNMIDVGEKENSHTNSGSSRKSHECLEGDPECDKENLIYPPRKRFRLDET